MSIMPGYRSTEKQLMFWEEPLGSHGHIRTVIGNLFEDLTAEFIGGRRHRTQSDVPYCPDVSRLEGGGPVYYESKGVGRSRTGFVYAGRLRKDRAFARQHKLVYAVWHHRAQTKLASTVQELERLVLSQIRTVYIFPFPVLDMICANLPEERLNSKYYHPQNNLETYGSGFRFNLRLLEPYTKARWDAGVTPEERQRWIGGLPGIMENANVRHAQMVDEACKTQGEEDASPPPISDAAGCQC